MSVVIATKDRLALLRRVLAAVTADPATGELVIVDDASNDGTAQWLRNWDRSGPPLTLVSCRGVGPGAVRQAGVERASGELVVLLDDDVVPRPGLVSGHLAALRGEPMRIVLGYSPVALPARRGPGDVARFAYARDYERRCERYRAGAAPVLHNLWGGNVGIWRESALRVGLSSPHFGERRTFYEDRDFGLRALRAGLEGVFDPSLVADHHHSRSADAALGDAVRRGACGVRLHRLHGDLIGPYRPWPLPAVAAPGLRAGGLAAIALAGRARAWGAQDASFKLTRRVCEQRGAAMELRR
jgi:glycosyltransferase involved in cell wall biosynthesis